MSELIHAAKETDMINDKRIKENQKHNKNNQL